MSYHYKQKVLFKHCDPAGIGYYPRIIEIVSDAIESFFDSVVGWPFEALHRTSAVPTVSISMRFRAPIRHGDQLSLELGARKVGRTSLNLAFTGTNEGRPCFEADLILVHVEKPSMKSEPWPAQVRDRLNRFREICQ